MSTIGHIVKDLPEDIEARIAVVQESISQLERDKITLEASVGAKKEEESQIAHRIEIKTIELEKLNADQTEKTRVLEERELKISQKESALDGYANALKEKETKIDRCLSIFERMKQSLGK